MSSDFSGGVPDSFSGGRRSTLTPPTMKSSYNTSFNPQQQLPRRSPLAGIPADPASQIHRPHLIGKRSLAEFQQNQGRLVFNVRNVKHRPNYHHASPVSPLSTVDFPVVPFVSAEVSSNSSVSNSVSSRYRLPILQQRRPQPLTLSNRNIYNASDRVPVTILSRDKGFGNTGMNTSGLEGSVQESEKNMMNSRLQELEKRLLGDEEDGVAVSAVTHSEWSETIQDLIGPTRKPTYTSPTSSSSSCSSTSASPPQPCSKQALIDASAAISDGKPEAAAEILTRLPHEANAKGTPDQRVAAYVVSALKSCVEQTKLPPPVSELYGEEHAESTEMLYSVSPCFKLGFVAANLAILEATTQRGFEKVHVLDFDIGQGGQYVHLLHALAAKRKLDNKPSAELSITSFTDLPRAVGENKLRAVGRRLEDLADKIGVSLNFRVRNLNISALSRAELGVHSDEALAVNFAFKLYKLPDESVSTENLRDEVLRRVKALSPQVIALLEQELNTNTAPLTARVRHTGEYYGAVLESLDATVPRDGSKRARIEEGLSRKIGNSVACEGRDRVERCEVFGKWRARMSMAGFRPLRMSKRAAEFLNPGTRGNPGFTVSEESGGICFGWKGRTLTVASAWR